MKDSELKKLRERIPIGAKIKCIYMKDPYPVLSGTLGIVKSIDDAGQIHVHWKNGSSLALIPNKDIFEIVATDIEVGDTILYKGEKIKVVKILTQDSYIFSGEEIHDVEFFDDKGNYRHWKSNIDGGHLCKD